MKYLAYLDNTGTQEGYDDCHQVDGELELKELGDAVVHVATPHHRLHDAREIIIG